MENKVPGKIGEYIIEEKPLQIFSNGTKTYYIVYQSTNEINDVPSLTEEPNKWLTININEGEPLESPKTYIFKLSTTEATDTLNLTINGESRPFDNFVIY